MKPDFTQSPPQPRTLKEAQELINVLWTLCGELPKLKQRVDEQQHLIEAQQKEIEELKEKLNTNSDNSSKPPSSNIFKSQKNKKKKGKRNRGGQTGHTGVTRNLLPEEEVDRIEHHYPIEHCPCGGHVQATRRYRRHQVHEIPPVKPVVTEHQLFYGCCEQCGKEHRAELPSNVPTGMLGPCLLALIATLTSDYKMSKRDVTRLLLDLYSLSICIATVKRAEETVSEAMAAPVEEVKAYVKSQKIVNCDETIDVQKSLLAKSTKRLF